MSAPGNGGPAFPTSHSANYPTEIVGGMTLRDYFAAKAMQAFIGQNVDALGDLHLAEESYRVADSMLKARSA
jgi:hypothetical protein